MGPVVDVESNLSHSSIIELAHQLQGVEIGSDLKEGAAYITNAENVRIGLRISALAFFVRYYGPRPLLFSHGNVPVSAYIEGMVVVKLPT